MRIGIDVGGTNTDAVLMDGRTVIVLGIPCHKHWRTPEGLKVIGLRYFGYEVDYAPVEEHFR